MFVGIAIGDLLDQHSGVVHYHRRRSLRVGLVQSQDPVVHSAQQHDALNRSLGLQVESRSAGRPCGQSEAWRLFSFPHQGEKNVRNNLRVLVPSSSLPGARQRNLSMVVKENTAALVLQTELPFLCWKFEFIKYHQLFTIICIDFIPCTTPIIVSSHYFALIPFRKKGSNSVNKNKFSNRRNSRLRTRLLAPL